MIKPVFRAQSLDFIPDQHVDFKEPLYQSPLSADMTKEGQFLSSVAVLAVPEPWS